MNATPTNLSPANAVQAQSAAGRQQDAAAPEVPFSQVLSGEIAQNRSSGDVREGSAAKAGAEPASQPATAEEAVAAPAGKVAESESPPRDPLDPLLAEALPVPPDALLALAIPAELLKPAPANLDGAPTEEPADLGAAAPFAVDPRKGRASPAAHGGQAADEAAGARKLDPALSGKADIQAAAATSPAAASATAFSGQLSAARQADAAKAGERLSDLTGNPHAAATPHALPDAASSLDSLAAGKLAPSVGTSAWNQALGEKIVWMAAGAQQTASLTLNPPNMGPLQIVLNITNDQATASFFSAQAEVRQALESAFPRLREMMNEAGIQLGQATVSADTPRQNDTSDRQAQRVVPPFIGADDAVPAVQQALQVPARQSGRGLIDTFA